MWGPKFEVKGDFWQLVCFIQPARSEGRRKTCSDFTRFLKSEKVIPPSHPCVISRIPHMYERVSSKAGRYKGSSYARGSSYAGAGGQGEAERCGGSVSPAAEG